MGIFVCDKCHAYANSASAWYHSRFRNQKLLGKDYPDGEAYCGECTPTHYASGEPMPEFTVKRSKSEKRIANKENLSEALSKRTIMLPLTKAVIKIIGSKKEVERLYNSYEGK